MGTLQDCNGMSMCRSLHRTPFKGSNAPAVARTTLQQHHSVPVSFGSSRLAQTCNSRQRNCENCHALHPTAGGRLGSVGAIPTTLSRRLATSAAASNSGSTADTTRTACRPAGSTPGDTAGSTFSNSAGYTPGSTAGRPPSSTPGSTAGSTPGSAPSSTSGGMPGSTPSSTPSSTAGSTAGSTPGSTAYSTPGSTAGRMPGSTAASTSGPSSSTTGPGAGLAGMLQQWNWDSKQLKQQLQSLGLAGVVAYGLFNTAYYTVAFLFVWFKVANVPAGLGLQAAARKAAEVFALVWAGSQVTKLLRAGGALAFAPVVDQGLTWAVKKLRLNSKQQALWLVVMACTLLAAAVFGFVVVVHA